MSQIAHQLRLSDIVCEYENKRADLDAALETFEKAGDKLKTAATIGGTYGDTSISTGMVCERDLQRSLLISAWKHVYAGLQIDRIASAADKRKYQTDLQNPAPFTLDNIRASFGDYLIDPRGNILRGLAEVFGDLDPAYKSHDKVRVGVKGLPKRVIIGFCNSAYGYGRDKIRDILNALAAYQNKPLVTYDELEALWKDEDALLPPWVSEVRGEWKDYPARGVSLRRFANGNGHLSFDADTLKDINRALAEYYGEVLPDCSEDKPAAKRASTEVAKDLQFYPTPLKVVDRVLRDLYLKKGETVLEPSCGDGRFMDAIRKTGASVVGIEIDHQRAASCRAKGHTVVIANFLEQTPSQFDYVVMNPPFYGKHYAKHVEHALKFLKPGGTLTAILPATARYDHGLVDGHWEDLPVGSFSESGTNINTCVLTIRRRHA